MSAPKMRPGKTIRLPAYDETTRPAEVTISSPMARRCQWLRQQVYGDLLCDVYRDPATGEVYVDPEGVDPDVRNVAPRPRLRTRRVESHLTEGQSPFGSHSTEGAAESEKTEWWRLLAGSRSK